ncbi:hypothetical protein ACFV5G_12000 [Streptomyces sp. NPDC059766]|uniref:hypothetical protein n=1 Tax=Streptomyces sp. NPDC059766 TaxID=3346940 RepID=UPI00365F94C0
MSVAGQGPAAGSSVGAGRDQGRRRGEETNGRKRHIGVDTFGLLLDAMVAGPSVTDRDTGTAARLRRDLADVSQAIPIRSIGLRARCSALC